MCSVKTDLTPFFGESSQQNIPKKDKPIRAFVWARVSTDMQEDRGLSMPEQLREIKEYAKKNGIEVVDTYQEAASAFQREDKRIEFLKMIERAKTCGEVNAILVHDMSRFSRDSLRAQVLIKELRDIDIKVISLNDPDIDPETSAGVYMEAITHAKNKAYSIDVAFHTRKGCRANVQTQDEESGWCYWNGGQPVWGYKIKRLDRGVDRSGRPIIKSIIVPDDTVYNGKQVHEWIKYCLEELAAKGASLVELRDFCNNNGIPGKRTEYWNTSTWSTLLQPNVMMTYCGFGVWNVHKKNGQKKPVDEWVIVENHHEALISEETAQKIMDYRRKKKAEYQKNAKFGYSRYSKYLLSGGLFKCDRCGANMIGYKTDKGTYYVCGSKPYRKGMGCGPGVYVPYKFIEAKIVEGVDNFLSQLSYDKVYRDEINGVLKQVWERESGYDPQAEARIKTIDKKIANIRRSIEDGLTVDIDYMNSRLTKLLAEREILNGKTQLTGDPPEIGEEKVREFYRKFQDIKTSESKKELKGVLRGVVYEIKLAPEARVIRFTPGLPEPIMLTPLAGGGFEPPTSGL